MKSKNQVTKSFKKESVEEFLDSIIKLMSVLYIPEDAWLKPREREFIVHSIIIRSQGIRLGSGEAVKLLKTKMGFRSKADVYNYRNKLKDHGWLIQTKDDLDLSMMFDSFRTIKQKVGYKFFIEH